MDSPDWMRHKRAKTNLIKNDNKCFDYTATPLTLNYKKMEKDSGRITKLNNGKGIRWLENNCEK